MLMNKVISYIMSNESDQLDENEFIKHQNTCVSKVEQTYSLKTAASFLLYVISLFNSREYSSA